MRPFLMEVQWSHTTWGIEKSPGLGFKGSGFQFCEWTVSYPVPQNWLFPTRLDMSALCLPHSPHTDPKSALKMFYTIASLIDCLWPLDCKLYEVRESFLLCLPFHFQCFSPVLDLKQLVSKYCRDLVQVTELHLQLNIRTECYRLPK